MDPYTEIAELRRLLQSAREDADDWHGRYDDAAYTLHAAKATAKEEREAADEYQRKLIKAYEMINALRDQLASKE